MTDSISLTLTDPGEALRSAGGVNAAYLLGADKL